MSNLNFGFSPTENGKVTVAYASPELQNFAKGDDLFFLKFKVLENTALKDILKITSSLTPAIAYDEIGTPHNIVLAFGDDVQKAELNIYPNPTSDNLYLEFFLEKENEITLEIYNSLGQLEQIIFQNKKYQKGFLNQKIPLDQLSSGTYFISLKTKEQNLLKRFVKL